ncbi:MAG: aldehyde dehydrogenase EutE [Candidatus Heimdallarchaeota archaeon]|nr:MAG: aldehyde dehydrogenase EutE [Candidatus Heimdallarchaeota archaeon]
MTYDEQKIARIVDTVVKKIRAYQVYPGVENIPMTPGGGIFQGIEEAINAAETAYSKLMELSLEKRKELIQSMRETGVKHARYLAELAVQETGLGRLEDKVAKNLLCARKTPGVENLVSTTWTGDRGLTLIEMGPYGVIGSITPCTNPAATIINNGISMVAAGNCVVFNPHPLSKRVTNEAIRLMNRAIIEEGGPENVLTSIVEPTIQTAQVIMKHPKIRCLVVTGGGEVVKAAMTSGKKTIAAGPGNPPVIVDDTANIKKAARGIVEGASFDNNIVCIAEKEVFAFENITDRLKAEMQKYGAYEVVGKQIDELVDLIFKDPRGHPHPVINRDFIGKDARLILEHLGISVSDDIRLIIVEVPSDDHPLVVAEQLMPILPIVRVKTIEEALEKAKKAEHGFKHTATMWSDSLGNLSLVARHIETTIFVKNAPSFAGLGYGGEGFTSMTIAGPTGEGLTCARIFTRQRRCVLVDAFRIV